MTEPDAIFALEARTLQNFDQLQDFQVFTGFSYDRYAKMAAAGQLPGTVTNTRTRTTLTAAELSDVLLGYLDQELPQVVLYHVVSHFEAFFFDFLGLLLTRNPHALSMKRQLIVEDVVSAADMKALLDELIRRELNEIQYKAIADWFGFLGKVVNLRAVTPEMIGRLAELKAARDVLAHNKGIANETYVRKAGNLARAAAGQPIPISRQYVYDATDFLKSVVKTMMAAARERFGTVA